MGHPAGTGYTFWGHSIAVVESGFFYPFFKVMFYIQFPSFALAMLVARVFSPHLLLYGFVAGISKGGWLLLAVMAISFFQWYLVGLLGRKIHQREEIRMDRRTRRRRSASTCDEVRGELSLAQVLECSASIIAKFRPDFLAGAMSKRRGRETQNQNQQTAKRNSNPVLPLEDNAALGDVCR